MKSKIILLAVAGLGLSVLSGCGKSENLNYDFTENGCDTGNHQFQSKTDYCAGLKNDSLNNGCAADIRNQEYSSNCS